MHQKCWSRDLFDLIDVFESVRYQIFEQIASFLLSNCPNRFESGHQEQCTWITHGCNVASRTTSHTSTEDYDVLFFNAKNLVYVIIDVECIL